MVLPSCFRGESNGLAKLTEIEVTKIRTLYARGGITYRELGTQFGVHFATVGKIINRERWAHITAEAGA
jgi:DNA invertase Pin-like site-specific DNA recombinase